MYAGVNMCVCVCGGGGRFVVFILIFLKYPMEMSWVGPLWQNFLDPHTGPFLFISNMRFSDRI